MTWGNLTLSTFGLLWLLKPRLVQSPLKVSEIPKAGSNCWSETLEIQGGKLEAALIKCQSLNVQCPTFVILMSFWILWFFFFNKAMETLVVNTEPACKALLLHKNPLDTSNVTFCWTSQFHDTARAVGQRWALKCKKMNCGSLDGTLTRLPDVGIFPSIYGRVPGWRTTHARTKGGFGCSPG